jgi:1,4-dihydroxy-2-naphthoate octaprenyltransferase
MERPGMIAPALASSAPLSPSALGVWWLAARPKTLPAAATPVLVGSACAHAAGGLALLPALAALAGALLLQIAANFANDVFDYEKGADTSARVGPLRAVQSGWVSPRAMRRALGIVLGAALLIGVYLASVAGPAVVGLGLVSIVAAVAYTGGPYPLGYHGLGDVCVFAFFGLAAVCGTCFVQAGSVTPLAWYASVPVGCLATAILVVNNVRDRETDVGAGKRTLPVRFGARFGIAQYRALLAVAYLTPVALIAARRLDAWALLPWLTLPLALRCSRSIARDRGATLNATLARTGALLLLYGIAFAVAILLGAPAWPRSS